MPIVFEEKRKRQRLLLGVFLVLVFVGLFVAYRELSEDRVDTSVESSSEPSFVQKPLDTERLRDIKLDRSIFEESKFKNLEINGILPIVVRQEELGRTNPFLSFEP